jgi:hypothetical protein
VAKESSRLRKLWEPWLTQPSEARSGERTDLTASSCGNGDHPALRATERRKSLAHCAPCGHSHSFCVCEPRSGERTWPTAQVVGWRRTVEVSASHGVAKEPGPLRKSWGGAAQSKSPRATEWRKNLAHCVSCGSRRERKISESHGVAKEIQPAPQAVGNAAPRNSPGATEWRKKSSRLRKLWGTPAPRNSPRATEWRKKSSPLRKLWGTPAPRNSPGATEWRKNPAHRSKLWGTPAPPNSPRATEWRKNLGPLRKSWGGAAQSKSPRATEWRKNLGPLRKLWEPRPVNSCEPRSGERIQPTT